MRKTDKKIDNQLRLVLTDVCEISLKKIDGFQWLTHLVDYSSFPKSLMVICIFDTNAKLEYFQTTASQKELESLIKSKLLEIGVKVNNVYDHITYDSEESCEKEHDGKWAARLV